MTCPYKFSEEWKLKINFTAFSKQELANSNNKQNK